MKPQKVRTVIEGANAVKYVISSDRELTDGQIYSLIRVALLGRRRPQPGETVEINLAPATTG